MIDSIKERDTAGSHILVLGTPFGRMVNYLTNGQEIK